MQKLELVNNEIYLLMQDIIKLIDRDNKKCKESFSDNPLEFFEVNINVKDLIFHPNTEQLKKALRELQFLKSEWIENNKENALIYFIDEIKFSLDWIYFKISSIEFKKLDSVKFNLSKYIDEYIE